MNLPPIQLKDFFGEFAALETEEQTEKGDGVKTDGFNGLLAELFTAEQKQNAEKMPRSEEKAVSHQLVKAIPERQVEQTELAVLFAEILQKTDLQTFSKGSMQPVQTEKIELGKAGQVIPTTLESAGKRDETAIKLAIPEDVPERLPDDHKRMTKITEPEVRTDRLLMKQPEETILLSKNELEAAVPLKQADMVVHSSRAEQMKAAPAEAKTLAEVKNELEKQVAELEKMKVGREQLFIRLKPAHLGQIELILKKSADQLIIRAEYTESGAKEKVTQVMQELRTQYKEKGMDIQFVTAERVPPSASKAEASLVAEGNQRREPDGDRGQNGREQQEKREHREQAEKIEADEEEQDWIFPL
ncbi:flagellar hook-length control protein FliK [Listeria costaricensis]|uniref:flagellar hook-length control protein FliK n=1 Tax=Listeria costaricensis TaxID=2026604 RepID=UPI000C076417|nr:flagellar hook-length control protein FliK [Listeria costaricensis]